MVFFRVSLTPCAEPEGVRVIGWRETVLAVFQHEVAARLTVIGILWRKQHIHVGKVADSPIGKVAGKGGDAGIFTVLGWVAVPDEVRLWVGKAVLKGRERRVGVKDAIMLTHRHQDRFIKACGFEIFLHGTDRVIIERGPAYWK